MERECGSKKTLFSEEELQEISEVIVGDDYVEVMCGCTSHRYGDAIARLRVFSDGDLQITCQCTPACHEDKLSPAAFEKHSERETSRNWRNNVWVFIEGDKVPLSKTVLLRYYNQTLKNNSNGSKVIHRDEFVGCSRCGKERRFRLRSRGECRKHHDALAEPNWKCCDYPYHKITCDAEEERVSRKVYRGCTRSPSCKGCTSCVCFGCNLCRFSDCNCQTCFDFTSNTQTHLT
ncbi:Protein ULTRAPETALA 2 [Raphanus sativus]|nr:protein ULTRAPETALA 2 isoform X3 [Raphanus sativus]XP_018441757.1 PREDICTED: protein ULTRAPETALA 2 isoform X1 [Raphanus sativus]XP_056843851.1 protein ULTRAPETALA 2 isoform X3 [Raphanus sativus]XP_056843852.1 protein ULTRAPETALA 2 isoform X3 [Raphanus sativus]XP_056855233.1 protein ULTRAPETALA 2 [Raphanus sativus]KAJ4869073.1 Protein ULTRAPETALA 2 [Raphanus sativus]KAJ4886364.1 Protein ULTRAPETALA 2 [Raphanus sativus]